MIPKQIVDFQNKILNSKLDYNILIQITNS
jgi:hypothetical protein